MLMTDHLGRYAQQGYYLARNKERIETEGKCCGNCDNMGFCDLYCLCELTSKEILTSDTCGDWENTSLSPLIKI